MITMNFYILKEYKPVRVSCPGRIIWYKNLNETSPFRLFNDSKSSEHEEKFFRVDMDKGNKKLYRKLFFSYRDAYNQYKKGVEFYSTPSNIENNKELFT